MFMLHCTFYCALPYMEAQNQVSAKNSHSCQTPNVTGKLCNMEHLMCEIKLTVSKLIKNYEYF